jgi:hypothetical protein
MAVVLGRLAAIFAPEFGSDGPGAAHFPHRDEHFLDMRALDVDAGVQVAGVVKERSVEALPLALEARILGGQFSHLFHLILVSVYKSDLGETWRNGCKPFGFCGQCVVTGKAAEGHE